MGIDRHKTSFCEEDYATCLELMAQRSADRGVEVWDWRWSSATAHLLARDNRLVKVAPLLAMVPIWRALLDSAMAEDELKQLRAHSGTGHPLGRSAFVERLEKTVGRSLRPRKPGRKPKSLNQPQ